MSFKHRVRPGGRPLSALILAIALGLAACGGPSVPSDYGRGGPAVGVSVQKGDTVYAIARRYGVTPRGIIEANGLKPPYTLYPGDRLRLPAPRAHTVRKGETVYGIARAYQTDTKTLAAINGIRPPYTIEIGQKLVIPTPGQTVASAPSKSAPSRSSSASKQAAALKAAPKAAPVKTAKAAPPQKPLSPPPPRTGRNFTWPAKGPLISTYGPKANGLHNDGINIALPAGTPVKAAESGVVAYAGNELRGYGNLVLIRHADGWTSAYAHNLSLAVKRGDKVKRGQVIARSGQTGGVGQPQLHFELRKGTRAVDPKRYLGSG